MTYTYKAMHISSGKTFDRQITEDKVREYASQRGITSTVESLINSWNEQGGHYWKYWLT